jgi:hypothetical protein
MESNSGPGGRPLRLPDHRSTYVQAPMRVPVRSRIT